MGVLAGKHALVTGGGTGVGAAIALALVAEGAVVTISGRRQAPLDETAAQSDAITAIVADVTDETSVTALYSQARAVHGPVDIVVANAGAAESAPFGKIDQGHWQRMLDVNLTGVFLTLQAALPDMLQKGWGRMISVASTAGLKGYPYVAAYCAAKHGVVGLTKALAMETAQKGITVNALCPGFIDTPLLDKSVQTIMDKTGRTADEARTALAASNPQGRLIQPREVADTAVWLCSKGAGSVTGQSISISGGEV
ncbi:MAG: SDR family oxidoreductase [Kordiimonadaceae bacterium]|nr:SDR family oxidoreductase [Kordiimonadaceae bacterium]